jgi:hypothetical protein
LKQSRSRAELSSDRPPYVFDRYRGATLKAEGAKIYNAANVDEARTKAAKLFYEPGDELLPWYPEEFRLRTE